MVPLISQVAVADTLFSMLKPEGKMQVGTSYGNNPFHNPRLLGFLLSSSAHHPVIYLHLLPDSCICFLISSAGEIWMGGFSPVSIFLSVVFQLRATFRMRKAGSFGLFLHHE